MNEQVTTAFASIFLAVVGVATTAVLVSKNSNTSGVLNSFTGGLATDLSAAEAPVSGGSGFNGFTNNYSSPSFGING